MNNNTPLILLSEKHSDYWLECTIKFYNSFFINLYDYVDVTFYRIRLTEEMMNNKIKNSFYECLLGTNDYNTRKFLLDTIVPNYTHPTASELMTILKYSTTDNSNTTSFIIKSDIDLLKRYLEYHFYVDFLCDGDTQQHKNYYIFDFKELYSDNIYFNKISDIELPFSDEKMKYRLLLLPNSLIEYIKSNP